MTSMRTYQLLPCAITQTLSRVQRLLTACPGLYDVPPGPRFADDGTRQETLITFI